GLGGQVLGDQLDRRAVHTTIGIDQVPRDLNARVLLFREGGLWATQREDGADFDTGGSPTGRRRRARGGGQNHPNGGELPKSHRCHSRWRQPTYAIHSSGSPCGRQRFAPSRTAGTDQAPTASTNRNVSSRVAMSRGSGGVRGAG